MKILITGASGFLGQYVVCEALRRGHQVRAIVRPTVSEKQLPWHSHPSVDLVRLDLRQRNGLNESLQGIDAVIHLAAAKAGDFYSQFSGTVIATENLLDAMVQAGVQRLVAISTFSVYDYLNLGVGKLLDENSPLEKNPLQRDGYAQTKLIQEQLFRTFEQDHGGKVTVIRPGIIYGREDLWHALVGIELSDTLWLCIAPNAHMPLAYVENCADAIVTALICENSIGKTINIVDDDLPSRRTYIKELCKKSPTKSPRFISINWVIMDLIARATQLANQILFENRAKLPGLLAPAKLHARFKPLRYSNNQAKQLLEWMPRYSLETALDRCCSSADLLDVSHHHNLDNPVLSTLSSRN